VQIQSLWQVSVIGGFGTPWQVALQAGFEVTTRTATAAATMMVDGLDTAPLRDRTDVGGTVADGLQWVNQEIGTPTRMVGEPTNPLNSQGSGPIG